MGTSKLEIRVAEREQLDATGADDIEFLFTPFPGSPQLPMGKSGVRRRIEPSDARA